MAKKTATPVSNETPSILQFKILLKGSKPSIVRKVQVPNDFTFEELHGIIQLAMGWENSHLYSFDERKKGFSVTDDRMDDGFGSDGEPASETLLTEYFKVAKDKLTYTYDFGDSWEHDITLEKIVVAEVGTFYPCCIDGQNACPPEDCGGLWGFYDIVETVNDLENPDEEGYREWLGLDEGELFDLTDFDKDLANKYLKQAFAKRKPAKKKKTTTKKEPKLKLEIVQKPILINLSNHPYATWSEEQKSAASIEFAQVEDFPFPNIPATANIQEVHQIIDSVYEELGNCLNAHIKKTKVMPKVHIMGEMVFTFNMVYSLSQQDIQCIASTSERIVEEKPDGQKLTTFRFGCFRPYLDYDKVQADSQEMGIEDMFGGDSLEQMLQAMLMNQVSKPTKKKK